MKLFGSETGQTRLLNRIQRFVVSSSGLQWTQVSPLEVMILQSVDRKMLRFETISVEEVLEREDAEGKEFLQINFREGKKILVTDGLIGFKPLIVDQFEMERLPKVVTTPDLISVLEALEEVDLSPGNSVDEMKTLKKIFLSIVGGGEEVGFDLTTEKNWLQQFSHHPRRAVA